MSKVKTLVQFWGLMIVVMTVFFATIAEPQGWWNFAGFLGMICLISLLVLKFVHRSG